MSSQRGIIALGLAVTLFLLVLTLFLGYGFFYVYINGVGIRYTDTGSRLSVLSQQLPRVAQEAVSGQAAAFDQIEASSDEINKSLRMLDADASDKNQFGLLRPLVKPALDQLQQSWQVLTQENERLRNSRSALLNTRTWATQVEHQIPNLLVRVDELVEQFVAAKADRELINLAGRQRSLIQRIRVNLAHMIAGGADAYVASTQLNRDARLFEQTLRMLKERSGIKQKPKLQEVDSIFQEIRPILMKIQHQESGYFTAMESAQYLQRASDGFAGDVESLLTTIRQWLVRPYHRWVLGVLGVLLIVGLILVGTSIAQYNRRRISTLADSQDKLKQSIEDLQKNMDKFCSGDLSVESDATNSVIAKLVTPFNQITGTARELFNNARHAKDVADKAISNVSQASLSLEKLDNKQRSRVKVLAREFKNHQYEMEKLSEEVNRTLKLAQNMQDIGRRGTDTVTRSRSGLNNMLDALQETVSSIKSVKANAVLLNDTLTTLSEPTQPNNKFLSSARSLTDFDEHSADHSPFAASQDSDAARQWSEFSHQLQEAVKLIQDRADDALSQIELAADEATKGSLLADNAAHSLSEIEAESKEFSICVESISARTATHLETISALNIGVTKLKRVSQQFAKEIGTVLHSCANLGRLSDDVSASATNYPLTMADQNATG